MKQMLRLGLCSVEPRQVQVMTITSTDPVCHVLEQVASDKSKPFKTHHRAKELRIEGGAIG